MSGTLYVVATPIGNLEDITLRALRILGEADLIACEDTRHTRKLLTHYGITTPTVSYHEHNEQKRARKLADRLEAGSTIALVSDAGTPLVSDPGYRIVVEAVKRSIKVVSIPGPSAVVAALAASGMSASEFTFAGFLPPKRVARRARLAELAASKATLVFYEAPHRIRQALADVRHVLGNRTCVLARELTKVHEEYIRGTVDEVAAALDQATTVRGEIVLLIGPPVDDNQVRPVSDSILDEVNRLMLAERIDQKTALKRVARARGISRSEAYRLVTAERAGRRVSSNR